MIDAPAHDPTARPVPTEDTSWPALGRTLLADLVGALRERLHLVALEGQQFVHAAGRLLAFGMVTAVLILTTWFVVVGALVALLVHFGLPLAAALLLGAALNLTGAALAWAAMRRQLALMAFPATLRALQIAPAAPAAPAATPASGEAAAAVAQADSRATMGAMPAHGDRGDDRAGQSTSP